MQIRPEREPSYSMRTGRQTDTMKLIVAFRNTVNAPIKEIFITITSK